MTTKTTTDWEELSLQEARGRHRESRTAASQTIDVCAFARSGRFFTERTVTSDISDSGCKFDLRTEVERESVLAIRVINRRHGREIESRPVLFQVARMDAQPGGWILGASLLQPIGPWWVESPELKKSSSTNS